MTVCRVCLDQAYITLCFQQATTETMSTGYDRCCVHDPPVVVVQTCPIYPFPKQCRVDRWSCFKHVQAIPSSNNAGLTVHLAASEPWSDASLRYLTEPTPHYNVNGLLPSLAHSSISQTGRVPSCTHFFGTCFYSQSGRRLFHWHGGMRGDMLSTVLPTVVRHYIGNI